MNQEEFDFANSTQKQNEYKVPFSFDFQMSNIYINNLNSNHNKNMQYNSIPTFPYHIEQNLSVLQQNFMIPQNNQFYSYLFIENQKEHKYQKEQIFRNNENDEKIQRFDVQKKKPIYRPHCKWSKEEDEKLKELVKEYGENEWRQIAKKMEGRNSRQCRERWKYYLNPMLKQGHWTIEEDQMILKKYHEYGPRWIEITKYFEHRTDAMIKNRYNSLIRIQKRKRKVLYVNDENHLSSSNSSESSQSNEISSFLILDQNLSDRSNNDNEISFFDFEDSMNNEMTNIDDYFQ